MFYHLELNILQLCLLIEHTVKIRYKRHRKMQNNLGTNFFFVEGMWHQMENNSRIVGAFPPPRGAITCELENLRELEKNPSKTKHQ